MFKHVIVVMVSAVLGAACGIQNLDALDDEADVEIVNADAGDASSGDGSGDETDNGEETGFASLGSTTEDDASTDGTPEADEAEQSKGDEDQTTADSGTSDPNSAGIIETAEGSALTLVGTEDRMSLSPDKPTGGWGYLTVDRAYTATTFADNPTTVGNKFVAIEYQVLAAEQGNFFDDAFRLQAGGETYSPLTNINLIGGPGGVFNDVMVFEVPATVTEVQLEGGAIGGSGDGFTTTVDIAFSPAADTADAPRLPDVEVEAIIGDIQLTSAEATMSMHIGKPTGGFGTLTVDGGRAMAKIEDTSAGPDFKFLEIDIQLLGQEKDNLFDESFRLETNGEWYPTLTGVNEVLSAGKVFNGSLVFRVPRDATDFVLEGGVPERWTDGLRATISFSLWDPAEGVDEPDAVASVPVEAEATSIALEGSESRMSTNPGKPRGWGTLTVDGASTTAKIEQNGAREGFKFIIIEYQILGGETDNFFDQAFRLEADGELYSPRNNINEIIKPGAVLNGAVIFEIPINTTSVGLQGGVVPGSIDGFTANYTISFI